MESLPGGGRVALCGRPTRGGRCAGPTLVHARGEVEVQVRAVAEAVRADDVGRQAGEHGDLEDGETGDQLREELAAQAGEQVVSGTGGDVLRGVEDVDMCGGHRQVLDLQHRIVVGGPEQCAGVEISDEGQRAGLIVGEADRDPQARLMEQATKPGDAGTAPVRAGAVSADTTILTGRSVARGPPRPTAASLPVVGQWRPIEGDDARLSRPACSVSAASAWLTLVMD